MYEIAAAASKPLAEKLVTVSASASEVPLATTSEPLKIVSAPRVDVLGTKIEAAAFNPVGQAIECESMLARRSAFEKAMSSADSLEARAEIAAQYTHESKAELNGGAYKILPSIEGKEKHHRASNYANEGLFSRENGPALVMDKADHYETASWGRSKEACEYREEQKELAQNGQWEKALQMDFDDVHDKFGSKYDEGIKQLSEYVEMILHQTANERD